MKKTKTNYCYNLASERFGAWCNIYIHAAVICAFVLITSTSFGQDSTQDVSYESHKERAKQQMKSESIWYRLTNQYELAPGCSKYSIGPSFITSTKNNDVQKQISIRYKSVHKEISFAQWTANATFDEKDTIENHNRITAGYFTPLNFFSLGKRELDIKGFFVAASNGRRLCEIVTRSTVFTSHQPCNFSFHTDW